ncbi:hypothetical protein [Actinomadura roseirufa]|uniref:hypothetical protein n=1 Tax=Actinomadura roseirufa TaxID=2094049 RepID=UPI0010414218|nr:hypothetical protein [Actinomadura roseirufa]
MLALGTAVAVALSGLAGLPGLGADADVLVAYERTGGFAGVHDHVTVDESGAADTGGGRVALAPGELAALRRDLARITTAGSSRVGCEVVDHFTYTLTYRGRRSTRCRLPSDWRPAVVRLDGLAGRGARPLPARR